MKETHWPKVGVGVMLFRERDILLGKRLNSHGENAWSPPGGHIDPFEAPGNAAIRETFEETGLILQSLSGGPWVNTVFEKEKKHYITLFMFATVQHDARPERCEPEKCMGWEWFDIDNLPKPLFLPIKMLLEEHPSVLHSFSNKD